MQTSENQEILPVAQTVPVLSVEEQLQLQLEEIKASLAQLEAVYRQFKKHDTASKTELESGSAAVDFVNT
ncbi:hypothetical protein [Gloeobacter morelensis]|uniref:Uncharacterized protein n=1 Tax=Gloeobacter morelensis MG652769 TaxID=2781736 RepID=A0ABY3PH19_9CYAN|nr:hypothetical protein [Gloeobacter morelensis]UFP92955.1 hypothetical protein ISF26_14140 [Gloeobacter morelensis MG652769]